MADLRVGSRVISGGKFSLVGCTVAPGFDFKDFEMAAPKNRFLRTYLINLIVSFFPKLVSKYK